MSPPAAIVDVDGTLVDTNYHHAVAWYRAFRASDVLLPLWRIHRHVGMGGDQELRDAGTVAVFSSLGELRRGLERTPFDGGG